MYFGGQIPLSIQIAGMPSEGIFPDIDASKLVYFWT
jgi:hypothetical protein